jgi:nascent polypeptide-associated complex subunit alpha
MIPGADPRQLKAMMRQMGMSQTDIDAIKVTIETEDKKIIFENPSVQKIVMQGQATFQISGDYKEEEIKPELNISEEDIEMVSEQTGVDRDVARIALEKTNGDIAQAIVEINNE